MRAIAIMAPVLLFAACTTAPDGPSVQVVPQRGKSLEVFAADNAICKQYAAGEVQGGSQSANNMQVLTGLGATVLGAGAGAAFGGGKGAAVGAALGAAGGVGYGGLASSHAQTSLQARYDAAFGACMLTRHNWVPSMSTGRASR